MADALTEEKFSDGERIIEQDARGDKFYIIKSGEVKITQRLDGVENDLVTIKAGAYFGELALITDQGRRATGTAMGDVTLLSIHRKVFTRVFGGLLDILKREAAVYGKFTGQIALN